MGVTHSEDRTEPHFIFLLTPPNSGSTAISKLLQTSKNVASLTEGRKYGEGQWLIDDLSNKDRWNRKLIVDEENLRTVWLNKFHKIRRTRNVEFIIEKSPPNMMRIDMYQKTFPNHTIIINNRSPYASVSSVLYRYTPASVLDAMTSATRREKLKKITLNWLKRSEVLKNHAITKNAPLITYEKFCANPAILQDVLDRNISRGAINLKTSVDLKVKDYPPKSISNFNSVQIERLSKNDLLVISNELKDQLTLLSFFGYNLFTD